ncbi:PaaI family thioesterase [Glaciecola sp. SC05]|uniref:PaaI family thioesterase n=1 Tax=Glaciecola sp. SC05 TaxID=1987355 RepID=UPI003529566C
MNEIPEGYKPLFRSSPFLDLIGPIYNKKLGTDLIVGMRIEAKHCNKRGTVHGGMLSTLADIALGYSTAFSQGEPVPLATASLTIDFSGAAHIGDWVEIKTDVQKLGQSLAFANCYFDVNDTRIARASAVFSVVRA